MTIDTCKVISTDVQSQKHLWLALNKVIEQNGVRNPYFKRFMADKVEANWIAIRVVYKNGNSNSKMVSRKRYCEVDWTGS